MISEQTRKRLRESHLGQKGFWTGKKRSAEDRKKMSKGAKGRIPHNKGKKTPSDIIQKLRVSHLGQRAWNKGMKGYLSKEVVNRIRQSVLANPPRVFKDTKPEKKVESELVRLGLYFEKQRPLCKIAVVDFYLPEFHIIIQVDGCYWHNCPIHSKIILQGKTERDNRQDAILLSSGFNVYRIWEHDVMGNDFDLSKILVY